MEDADPKSIDLEILKMLNMGVVHNSRWVDEFWVWLEWGIKNISSDWENGEK